VYEDVQQHLRLQPSAALQQQPLTPEYKSHSALLRATRSGAYDSSSLNTSMNNGIQQQRNPTKALI
jgi:hypothetical protein